MNVVIKAQAVLRRGNNKSGLTKLTLFEIMFKHSVKYDTL